MRVIFEIITQQDILLQRISRPTLVDNYKTFVIVYFTK